MTTTTHNRFGKSFFDLSLPLHSPYHAKDLSRTATLAMHTRTGRISIIKASSAMGEYVTDLKSIVEVIHSSLPGNPQIFETHNLLSSISRIDQINLMVKKHNHNVSESFWIAVLNIVLLVLTLGIFSYRDSLKIKPLPSSLLEDKLHDLRSDSETVGKFAIKDVKDHDATKREQLLEALGLKERLLQITRNVLAKAQSDKEPSLELFFSMINELPFTHTVNILLTTPFTTLLDVQQEKLISLLSLKTELLSQPACEAFPSGLLSSDLFLDACEILINLKDHAQLPSIEETPAIEAITSAQLYALSAEQITPELGKEFSCVCFDKVQIQDIDFSSWTPEQIETFYLSDSSNSDLGSEYIQCQSLESLDSIIRAFGDETNQTFAFLSKYFPRFSTEQYRHLLQKHEFAELLKEIPFEKLSPCKQNQQACAEKLQIVAERYKDLQIEFSYFPSLYALVDHPEQNFFAKYNSANHQIHFKECDFGDFAREYPDVMPLLFGSPAHHSTILNTIRNIFDKNQQEDIRNWIGTRSKTAD